MKLEYKFQAICSFRGRDYICYDEIKKYLNQYLIGLLDAGTIRNYELNDVNSREGALTIYLLDATRKKQIESRLKNLFFAKLQLIS